MSYPKPLPVDTQKTPLQEYPAAVRAQAIYADEDGTASSVVTMTDNTTQIEIAAVGGPAVMRWVATTDTQASVVSAVSGANFDHVIPTGMYRKFVVPKERISVTSLVGVNIREGLFRRVATKSIGTASVLLTEY